MLNTCVYKFLELETSEPYFSSSIHGYSSYAAYPIPIGGISSNMELIFKFSPTTMDQISILMFIGQSGMHDSSSDHMAVSFVKGYVLLTWNLGSGNYNAFIQLMKVFNENRII